MQQPSDPVIFDEGIFLDSWEISHEDNRDFLELCALSGKVTDSLSDGLNRLDKNTLKELGADLSVPLKSSMAKTQLIELITEAITTSFADFIVYLPVANLRFLLRFKEQSINVIPKEAMLYRDISHTHNLGYLFLFDTGEYYTAVLPSVLRKMFLELDTDSLFSMAELHQRLAGYAVSLTNLYGVLDIDQFAKVWNRYESELLTPAQIGDEMGFLAFTWYAFWYSDELIISSYFDSEEMLAQFMAKVHDIPYYVPTKDELREYFSDPYNDRSPAVREMREFLSGYDLPAKEDIDDLLADLADVCIADSGMDNALDLLQQYGVLFRDYEDATKFTQLYTELDSQSRKWNLRGHTKDSDNTASHYNRN
ncbi:MAG: hypothetical protein PHP38_08270 [Sphaerochaetaceae bacterium]|jgi:hypothetical protein|nr:hypothetical protein [Sphaerochaetaceae bacterium]NLO60596.1 hypothetical protein [Spirochaetales bacterium]MDD3670006.1 hypothetical protein [Sphaerochaetaceae bacterium]MDD4259827.1 hypothetical protein [Sphaerochaetaceae bacterium]MDD4840789.1 hypothetical protein [Sphaerochaetaceae bacterium]